MTASPALVLRFPPDVPAAARDRLVALLADYSLVAIHEDDPVAPQSWTVHFASADARDAAAAALGTERDLALQVEAVEIADEDWTRRTQADLPPVRVGRITVAAPWSMPEAGRGADVAIVIEPSRGFGTGHHQSTRLCLVLLQRLELAGLSMIDVGTGSGILAIAGAMLGASRVEAIDEDPDAVENARENAERNGVAERVALRTADALASGGAGGRADLVTANLTGTLLARHADAVAGYVADNGRLIVSGFTIDERDRVLEAFDRAFAAEDDAEEDGWWGLSLKRREAASAPHHRKT